MGEVGGIPEDAYDDMITDDNERRKLQGYNINKEMKINTTRMSRSVCQSGCYRCRRRHLKKCAQIMLTISASL